MNLSVSTWKHGKTWAYSITYDEALADLARFVIPVHEELGIPGHVEVVAGQIGETRRCGESSYNGMRHMDAGELRALIAMGWGVGCHSWSHGRVMDDPDRELRQAKKVVEAAVGTPVTIYTSPGMNDNLTAEVQAKLREYGYLAGLSITDDINRPRDEYLLWVNRIPIHERYWGVFDSAFDAHKRIRQAQEEHGWLVDYCHCPLEKAVHDYKDCTAAHHRERLEAGVAEGGSDCWYANPDDVVDYRYMRRHARIETDGENEGRFLVRLDSLPDQVQCRKLTFELECASEPEAVRVDGAAVVVEAGGDILRFTVPVRDGTEIVINPR